MCYAIMMFTKTAFEAAAPTNCLFVWIIHTPGGQPFSKLDELSLLRNVYSTYSHNINITELHLWYDVLYLQLMVPPSHSVWFCYINDLALHTIEVL